MLLVVVISGCTDGNHTDHNIYINKGDIIPRDVCDAKGITDKVIVFYSSTCPVCKTTIPRLQLAESRTEGVEFEYILLDSEEGKARMQELEIVPYYVPTVIINCRAYGSMSQMEYEEIIETTR